MKKTALCITTAMLLLTATPIQLNAALKNHSSLTVTNNSAEAAEAHALMTRLYEIEALSKTDLSSPQKKVLRGEVRSIKNRLSDIGGGVYISVGALILILVLLIILF